MVRRLYYCPACGQSEILTDSAEIKRRLAKKTFTNIRDGYGRPISHYECDCGNLLAGSMDLAGWDDDGVTYAKAVIREYNEGGGCFSEQLLDAIRTRYLSK